MPNSQTSQEKFMTSEVMLLTILAMVGRNKLYSSKDSDKRLKFRESIKKELISLGKEYVNPISEAKHEKNIENLADKISEKHGDCLIGQRFRIGTAQKALNLFLKYLWCLGRIKEPPHFPVDSIMLSQIPKCSHVRWTQLDSIEEYREIIEKAKNVAKGATLAKWELDLYDEFRIS